jgi:hypothetical protein
LSLCPKAITDANTAASNMKDLRMGGVLRYYFFG